MAQMRSSKKDINTTDLHIASQISNSIINHYKQIPEEFSPNSLETFQQLNKIFAFSPAKLHQVFGNNLSKTNFISASLKLIERFVSNSDNDRGVESVLLKKEIIALVLSLHWNCTDSSELYCQTLLKQAGFKQLITSVLLRTPYDMENKHTVESCTSIINNIIRREKLRDSFKDYNLIDQFLNIYRSYISGRDMKMITAAMVFYMVDQKILDDYLFLVKDIKSDIVEIIDGASNDESSHCEGFSMKELTDMVKIFSRSPTIHDFFQNSNTLFTALIRMIGKDQKSDIVINFARSIYSDERFATLRRKYVEKFGTGNDKVIRLLND